MEHFVTPRTGRLGLDQYRGVIPERQIEALAAAAAGLAGARVVHVNSAANAGGVAEILRSQIPLERGLGLDARWLVMRADERFFTFTKRLHNLLQGAAGELSAPEQGIYLADNHRRAVEFAAAFDHSAPTVALIHDPQPLSLISYLPRSVPAIVRLHVDLSQANQEASDFVRPFAMRADRVVLSDPGFRPQWLPRDRLAVICPAIDPLAPKNRGRPPAWVRRALAAIGIDPARPIVAQVARFDPWKDPAGVVAAYRIAKRSIPGLQLALAGLIVAEDDPEAAGIYAALRRDCAGDPDIHLYGEKTPPAGLANDDFVNALQSGATVVVQKSLREGFGLTVAEAMWKGAAVIGGDAGGIRRQIRSGSTGFLVGTVEECAARLVELVNDPELRRHIGQRAREAIRRQFLMPRLVLDHLRLYRELLG